MMSTFADLDSNSTHMNPLAENEIRIIDLLPGEEGAPIRCEARVSSLSSGVEYEALSYVWGNHSNQVVIEVSETPLQITETLHSALCRLRFMDKKRSLWIDQLCINQNDLKEKATQVQKMRFIYTKCTRCLIWMGEIAEKIDISDAVAAVNYLEYLASETDPSDDDSMETPLHVESMAKFRSAMKALRTIGPQDGAWWHRVWTVQEAVLPLDKAFIWGPLTISWDTLLSTSCTWTQSLYDKMDEESVQIAIEIGDLSSLMVGIIWTETSRSESDDFLTTMLRWRGRKATDPLDNIYALTGLHTPGELPRTERCDYSLSATRAFSEFTVDLINKYGLVVLMFDPWLPPDIATEGLPRWALDMKSWPANQTLYWHNFWGRHSYEANKGLPRIPAKHNADDGTIGLDGYFVDTVKLVGDGYYIEEEGDIPVSLLKSWASLYNQNLGLSRSDTSSEHSMMTQTESRTFSTLLLGGLIRNSEWWVTRRATDEDVNRVSAFIETESEYYRDITINGMASNQRFFITEKGMLGLGNLDTVAGDEVWVFGLGRSPFTVRPRRVGEITTEHYDFVGHCYVQGIMQGELVAGDGQEPSHQTIWLH